MTFLVSEAEEETMFSSTVNDHSSLRGRWDKMGFLRAIGIRDLKCIPPVLLTRAVKNRDRMGWFLRFHAVGRVLVLADKKERREVFGVGALVLDILAEMRREGGFGVAERDVGGVRGSDEHSKPWLVRPEDALSLRSLYGGR